ncbi:PepSY domain-containing protein [Candidatus Colwellia aromaticivorans]|uniref:PepSY domain-containing protein n=1 Tax=Candidatus Colwellia aromaticivorans TaxID=2267621 RepID=UPI001444770A|nr:PepSY domain-containing protein [Candidatus Colwellia aromaticivorans]
MKSVLSLIIILVTTFMITFSVPAVAQGNFAATINTMKTNQQTSKQQVRVKSTKQAAQLAQRRFGGKVLKVQSQKSGYRVKLIKKDGHIISVFVDAKSGRISGR